jgi:hypothetical protein
MIGNSLFFARDKFQNCPAQIKREIDFKMDILLHGLLWAKTAVPSNVIQSGTPTPVDEFF